MSGNASSERRKKMVGTQYDAHTFFERLIKREIEFDKLRPWLRTTTATVEVA